MGKKQTYTNSNLARRWRRLDRRYGWRWRLANGAAALLMLAAAILPIAQEIWQHNVYALSDQVRTLVGSTDTSLAKQLRYDAETKTYEFNKQETTKDGMPAQVLKAAAGAKDKSNAKTYSLEVPADMSKGVTYTDTNSQLNFRLQPRFAALPGKTVNGHIVFPLKGSDNQAVYTLKNNGLKEDIIVPQVHENTMRFEYDLVLPKSLEARVIPDGDGAIGIYAADPALFGEISYGSDSDRDRVQKAREQGAKTNLVFGLPAPVVKDTDGHDVGAARFELQGTQLSVVADGLKAAKGPITIDPSVVVTSTSDFQTDGTSDGMIDFGTAGQIKRGGLTGGSVGTWNTTTNPGVQIEKSASVVYNGYMYTAGGTRRSPSTGYSTVWYVPINGNGTLGTWNTTSNLPYTWTNHTLVSQNGYLYVVGGSNTRLGGGATASSDVIYSKVNSDGTLGTWSSTTSLPAVVELNGAAAYNGYVYSMGGSAASANVRPDVYYARINADGTLSSWTATTNLTYARSNVSATVYNGYMYILGGANATPAFVTDVQYVRFNSDGTLGSWVSTNSFATARYGQLSYVYNGYIYITGGWRGSAYLTDTQYAQIDADGSLGAWRASSSITGSRTYVSGGAYNGYVYVGFGWDGSNNLSDMQYAKIDPVGTASAYTTSGNQFAASRRGAATVVNNGYMYIAGGDSGGAPTNTMYRAAIAADGTIGAFTADATFTTGRNFLSAVVYNGYMYIIGGCSTTWASCTTASNNLSNVQRAAINTGTGAITGYTAQTSLPVAVYGQTSFAANGYVYVLGGINGTTKQTAIYYQQIGSSGSLGGSWSTSSFTTPSFAYMGLTVSNNYVYIAGGCGTVTTVARCEAATANVYYAQLGTGGDLGSGFTQNATSFGSARGFAGLAVNNGYLYVAAGLSTGPASSYTQTYYSSTEYAKINGDGTVGTWNVSAPSVVANARYSAGLAAYGGYLYVVGGYDGTTIYRNVQIAAIGNGGSGLPGAWVTNGTSLSSIYPDGLGYLRGFAANGYMFIVGGLSVVSGVNTSRSGVYSAPLNADGSVGSWTATNSLSASRFQYGLATYNGYVYVVGGQTDGSTRLRTVEYAKINSNGTVGTWTSGTSTDATIGALAQGAVTAYGGYLYYGGGSNGTNSVNSLQYAPINSDASIGAWTATTSFNSARTGPLMFAYNGYLYILTGTNGSGTYYTDVQSAAINPSTGVVGVWGYTMPMEGGRTQGSLEVYNGYVYVWGGFNNNSTVMAEVMYAPVLTGGRIGNWTRTLGTSAMAQGQRNLGAQAMYNGNMYYVGGYQGSATYTDVQYAPVNSMSLKGTYTKFMDLGGLQNVTGITYNGTVPGGKEAFSYKAAGNDGVFAASGSALSSVISNSCSSTLRNARYLLVSVTLDDVANGGFQDADATAANLTDFTVNYVLGHPSPDIRLRGGKTLQAGTQTALDTCI